MPRGERLSQWLMHAILMLVFLAAGTTVSQAGEPVPANTVAEPPSEGSAPPPPASDPAPVDPAPTAPPADPVEPEPPGAPVLTPEPQDPIGAPPAQPESVATSPSSGEAEVVSDTAAPPPPAVPSRPAVEGTGMGSLIDTAPLPRAEARFVSLPRWFVWPRPSRRAVRSQAPGDRVDAIERACAQRPRSSACLQALAPVYCSRDWPLTDGPFSCTFAKRYSPCYLDYDSEACVLFRDDAVNPCLRRPDGPSCLRYLANPPYADCYPPAEGATPTAACAAYIAAFIDQCQTSPETCPGPYGGSQESLTVDTALRNGDGRDELPIDVPESLLETRPAADFRPAGNSTARVTLASTGLEIAWIAFTGLTLLSGGLTLRALVRSDRAGTARPTC
jgi:hypothetical protein